MAEYKILWTDSARTDLEAIVEFIPEEDPRIALGVLERLEKRARALRRFPDRGRVVSEMRTLDVFLYRELIERPWRMIYRFDDKRVYVLAVLDSRRELTSLLLERLAR
jgi:plasmid stabilization system protein ParE